MGISNVIECGSAESTCLCKRCSDVFHNVLGFIAETDVKRSCICQCSIGQPCGHYAALWTGAGGLKCALTVTQVLEQVDDAFNMLGFNTLGQGLSLVQGGQNIDAVICC